MDKHRCQSCGMPLSEENAGTNKNKVLSDEYCRMCFKDGKFIKPGITKQEMIKLSVDHMVRELKYSEDEAEFLAKSVIPKLKRWR